MVQGDRCIPITPLSGEETVKAMYNYQLKSASNPYAYSYGDLFGSAGTTDLQRDDTSILFLYDGPEGLSLVGVHGKLRGGSDGGAATFVFRGLDDGTWVVKDDQYDGPNNIDRWDHGETRTRVDWAWFRNRTDGFAYRGLEGDLPVNIDPVFNERAALYDAYGEQATVEEWQVLSGDRDDPERHSLALDEPITLVRGGCPLPALEPTVEMLPEAVNPRSNAAVPVVVRSSASFDATLVDPSSVRFGPHGAAPVGVERVGPPPHDVKFVFRVGETGIAPGDTSATIRGRTTDGRRFRGTVTFRTVPEKGRGKGPDDEKGKGKKKEKKKEKKEKKEKKKEKDEEGKANERSREKGRKERGKPDDDDEVEDEVEEESEEAGDDVAEEVEEVEDDVTEEVGAGETLDRDEDEDEDEDED